MRLASLDAPLGAAIHNDDHCTAYNTWMAGYAALPSDARLKKQALKRLCWDGNFDDDDDDGDEPSQNLPSLQAFRARTCPAQALFPSQSQNRNLVFKTQAPILTNIECEKTLKIVKHYIETVNNGDWGTVRSATVKTTDVAVEDIPELRPWLRILLRDKIYPLCEVSTDIMAFLRAPSNSFGSPRFARRSARFRFWPTGAIIERTELEYTMRSSSGTTSPTAGERAMNPAKLLQA